MRARLTAFALIAIVLLGCTPVAIRTPAENPQACEDALISGTLAKHPQTGLGIADADGVVTPVEWPHRYGARLEVGQIVLLDENGKAVAREGDQVSVGGGFGNAFWHACGPVTIEQPGG